MNSTIKKTTLFLGACMAFQLGGIPQMLAAPSTSMEVMQQTKRITGTVKDATGMEVIGANVIVKGTTNGVITDLDGKFSLEAAPGSIIEISYISYMTQEIPVTAQTSDLQITLKEDSQSLDEVVVVGYGVQKKKLVTGATLQVKGENIQKLNTTNPLGALQSQSPGVNIVANSGQPGKSFDINIRGAGTNGSTTPLYIIDGVEGDINSLSPADIESLDVLKDAASAAIYGSRAANGVVLITTKQGKQGKLQVSYDGYVGFQNVYKMPDLLNAKEYMAVMDQLNFNTGNQPYTWTNYMSQEQYNRYMSGEDEGTNWLDAIRNKNAITTSHSLNLAGGTERSKFSTGVSYTKQEGTLGKPVASDYQRFTVRMNSEHILWKEGDLDIITFGENLYYNHNESSGISEGNQYGNDISWMLRANPLVPIYNENGDYYMYDDLNKAGWFNYNSYTSNPIAAMVNSSRGNNKSKNYGLTMVGYLKVQPIKGLVYKGQVSYKQNSSSYRGYSPAYKLTSTDQKLTNEVTQNMTTGWDWQIENTLSYTFNIEKHNFDVLVGQSFKKSGFGMGEYLEATANDLLFSDWDRAYISNSMASQPTSAKGYPTGDNALASFFGRINYNFNEKYMASVILRTDGSSNFARGKRWGTFPSVSAGWVVSNEDFMENTHDWMDFLKIRASWGQNGNCNIDNFQYFSTVAFDHLGQYSFGNNKGTATQGGYASIMPNEDVTWETSEQLDLGLDARFLSGRLSLNFDWYNKKTKDLLIVAPILDSYGTNAPYINGGTVENKGVEIGLGWNDQKGDWTYGVNLNLAHNKNEVTQINNKDGYILGPDKVLAENTRPVSRMEVGHPIGYFWAYKTEGVMQNAADVQAYLDKNCKGNAANSLQGSSIQPGDLKFVDVNGDGVINEDDKTEVGNPHPDITMGLSFNVGYKGFDLAVTTYGAFGQQNMRSYRKFTDGNVENYTSEVFEYWHGEGTSNRYPRLVPGNTGVNFQQISDIFVEDASYFRIQNVTLGYDFKNLWKNCPLPQLRLYVSAQNLFTFTGYKGMDPEIGTNDSYREDNPWARGIDLGSYPSPRTYMVGVNIKF